MKKTYNKVLENGLRVYIVENKKRIDVEQK